MDEQHLRDLIAEVGLDHHLDSLLKLARPAIRLKTTPVAMDDLPVAASRFGGQPDLPPDFEWPVYDGQPHNFVAQFNLAEVAPFDAQGLLPDSGLLSFFYDSAQNWGGASVNDGVWYVLFDTGDPTELIRTPVPPNDWSYYPSACAVTLTRTVTLPPAGWWGIEALGLITSSNDGQRYRGLLDSLAAQAKESGPLHQLFGHPWPIQQPNIDVEVQMAAHGIFLSDEALDRDPQARALKAGASEWRLLLQVDTDDDANMQWGDDGRLYLWMRHDDLAARAFDQAWGTLQCY